MKYIISADIGIGSVGWAVICTEKGKERIENFGTRIFKSGEIEKNGKPKSTDNQERRTNRGIRRLYRRRSYRKQLLHGIFENIGLINAEFNDELLACKDTDVYALKVRALEEKLSPAELYKCLVHTCNHRGYRDFYENSADEDKTEEGKNKAAVSEFERRFSDSKKRTVSEYLLDETKVGSFVSYRNVTGSGHEYLLVPRNLLEDEVKKILNHQKNYYPALTDYQIGEIIKIVFNQRAFEDGPGDKNDSTRRYQGFLATIGHCPFFKEDERGFRSTVIADVYAVINILSQYQYVDKSTGEFILKPEAAKEIVSTLLGQAWLTKTDVKKIAKKYGLSVSGSEKASDTELSKSIKFLKTAKVILEDCGQDWNDWISEEQFDVENPSRLHRISTVLSSYQTPRYRREQLKKLDFLDSSLSEKLMKQKLSGTASTGYRYMCNAIEAFLSGDIYGNYQAKVNRELAGRQESSEKTDKLASIADSEIRSNPVVFKAVNETRKVINAIIAQYGTPDDIIIEVASELGKSFEEREKIRKLNEENEKNTDKVRKEIAALLYGGGESGYDSRITPKMIERYRLYHQQEGKDPYSGKPLGELAAVLEDSCKKYEVDHIIPYSLILDNTLNNKVLTFDEENQEKKQRTPLMYLTGEKREKYLKFINHLYARDNLEKGRSKRGATYPPVTKKKYEYLKFENIYSKEGQELLSDWKSRNINDTRYITKYIVGYIAQNLKFTKEGKHVWGIKGAVTSRFRRIWMKDTEWGEKEKNRETYLNHALDAVIIGNLTPAYIDIASDALKLQNLYYRHGRRTDFAEYREYLENCKAKMQKYYGFNPDYTAFLLKDPRRVPSLVPNLQKEVMIRFNDSDEARFNREVKEYYGDCSDFVIPPHMPVTSHRQNFKFKGAIADEKPIRIVEIGGDTYKIMRKEIGEITAKDLEKLYGADCTLISTLNRIFDGKKDGYKISDYMTEHELTLFVTDKGQPVRKVSVYDGRGTVSNFYRKQIDENNYTNLSNLKYYCIEVYKDENRNAKTHGIRFVDIVRKDKKLFVKKASLPSDYASHVMYLFPNDYVRVINEKGGIKFEGFYKAVFNINENRFYYALNNTATQKKKAFSISPKDRIEKYNISILGVKSKKAVKPDVPYPCC